MRSAIFFGAHDSGERATSDVESAAFIAEPRASATRARDVALRIATVRGGTSADDQDDAFTFANGRVQRDGEVSGHSDCCFRKSAFQKSGNAFGDRFAAGAADARADATNIASFQMMALENHVGRVTEREPGLRVSSAQRIRWARSSAREDVGIRIHQNAIGLGATAIETEIERRFWRGILLSHSFPHA